MGEPLFSDLKYLEIEHKFLVDLQSEPAHWFQIIAEMGPEKVVRTQVQDTYFLVEQAKQSIYRHRFDPYLQQLTVKSVGLDSEVRLEVNLSLDSSQGSQADAVRAFLTPQGLLWQGTLAKDVQAFYFADVEIVFYRATYADAEVCCLEFEARAAKSLEDARHTLAKWEKILGMSETNRTKASLVELLVVPKLPSAIQDQFRSMLLA
jgi:adenylate cyclase class IV